VGRFSVRGHRGTNRVRFAGRVGRKTLRPGTYRITARPVGRPRQARRVVLIVGSGPREELNCSTSNRYAFLGAAAFFGEGSGDAAAAGSTTKTTAPAPRTKKQDKKSRGVLPAIRKRIRELPEAIPRPPLPRPAIPGDDTSPPAILGLAALALLALSVLAILAYVIRFFRGPRTT
jgi:hypothetical protein